MKSQYQNSLKTSSNHQRLSLDDLLEQFDKIVDFKVQNGKRNYRLRWIKGNGKVEERWEQLDNMRPYLKELLEYEIKNKKKIEEVEVKWTEAYLSRATNKKLQTLNIAKLKKILKFGEQAEKESDSSFQIKKRKSRKIQKKIRTPKRKRTQRKKLIKQHSAKKRCQKHLNSVEISVIQPFKEELSNISSNQAIRDALEASVKTAENGEPSQHENDKEVTQNHSQAFPPQNEEIRRIIEDALFNRQSKIYFKAQSQESHEEARCQEIFAQTEVQVEIAPFRPALTDESQNASSQGEEFSYASNQTSEIVNHNDIREFLQGKLKEIQENEKNYSLFLESQWNKEQRSVKLEEGIVHEQSNWETPECKRTFFELEGEEQDQASLINIISQNFQKKLKLLRGTYDYQLPQNFQKFFSSRIISEQDLKKGQIRINNIISLYNLKDFCFFSVNIGNNYFEEQRFVEYELLKGNYLTVLNQWLKIKH